MSTCVVCLRRKGKRACPAKADAICSVCCGTNRRVTIDCPEDCAYLTGAHALPPEGRESENRQDLVRIRPFVQALDRDQTALFFYLLAGVARVSAQHRHADDATWHEATIAIRRTIETRSSGVIYEHQAGDWRAQALVNDMQGVLAPTENDGRPVADDETLLPVVKAVEGAIDAVIAEGRGPRAFLELAVRIAARIARAEEAEEGREEDERRIIEP